MTKMVWLHAGSQTCGQNFSLPIDKTEIAPLIRSRHMALYKCVLIDWRHIAYTTACCYRTRRDENGCR